MVEPTGAETIVAAAVRRREVRGRFEPDSRPEPGEPRRSRVDMAHACLFDPETER